MIKLLLLIAFSWHAEQPTDSIGIETVNGKTFVIHRVDEKETLFAISRRYRTTVDAILQYNASAGSGLEIGQILKVPYTPKVVNKPVTGVVHKVAPKETLYSISRMYQVSVDDIREWNNLAGSSLDIGQELIIKKSNAVTHSTTNQNQPKDPQPSLVAKKGVHSVAPRETLFSIARQYDVSVDQIRAWNNLEGNELKIGQTLYVAQPERGTSAAQPEVISPKTTPPPGVTRHEPEVSTVPPPEKNPAPVTKPEVRSPTQSAESIRISETLKTGDEIVEGGLAELIEGTEGNRKYLALHRTAPMGTILKVRNEMNNREVFVRVMGKLPDTALTNKLIIKISKSAYDRLGAIDPRFRVEVTYYK